MGSSPIQVAILASVAQSVEQWTENPRVAGSIPAGGTKKCGFSSSGRAPPCQGGGSEFEPRNPLHIRRHSQVVRQRSAKPLFPSSNLGGASSRKPCRKNAGRVFVLCKRQLLALPKFQLWTKRKLYDKLKLRSVNLTKNIEEIFHMICIEPSAARVFQQLQCYI